MYYVDVIIKCYLEANLDKVMLLLLYLHTYVFQFNNITCVCDKKRIIFIISKVLIYCSQKQAKFYEETVLFIFVLC